MQRQVRSGEFITTAGIFGLSDTVYGVRSTDHFP